MTTEEIKRTLEKPEYDFLKTNQHLGENIILLGLGGSHAYGTNIESSDIDIRGIATNSKREILLGNDFEQVQDKNTDSVIFSLKKTINLLINCNPNILEMLFLKPEHYAYISEAGQMLIENRNLFLSQKCFYSYGGYAKQLFFRKSKKLNKEMMHLVRLYKNAIEILSTGSFCTYCEKDHDLLMAIRNGEYTYDGEMSPKLISIIHDLETDMKQALKHTALPPKPDTEKIYDLVCKINEEIVTTH